MCKIIAFFIAFAYLISFKFFESFWMNLGAWGKNLYTVRCSF